MKLEIEIDDDVYAFLKVLGEMVDKTVGSSPRSPEVHAKMIFLESLWIMAKELTDGLKDSNIINTPTKEELN